MFYLWSQRAKKRSPARKVQNVYTMNSEKAPVQIIKKPDEEPAGNIPMHGYMFQLKLLVLFMCRALASRTINSFKLGTEIAEAGKFDDLVFEYSIFTLEEGRKKYFRLLQAKHKRDKTGNYITSYLLLKYMKSEFYLPIYFFSYLELAKASLFSGGIIKDIIICTNINFDDEILKNKDIKLKLLKYKDDVLDNKIGSLKKPERYKFTKEIVPKLKKSLNNYKLKSKKVLSDFNDGDIEDFINRLIFAVDCPSEQELDDIIKEEIAKRFDFLCDYFSVENTYCSFMMTMLDWLQGKVRRRFISDEEGKQFFEEAKEGIPVIFNIKNPVESFTGRHKELGVLHEALKVRSDKTKAICITGIGGVGKTELAKMYISKFRMEYNNNILWFNAESKQALEACFRTLARDKLGITTKNVDGKDKGLMSIVEDVYRALLKKNYLMVFDNAQHYQSENRFDGGIDRFLPPFSDISRPYILITSRNQRWPSSIHVLSLDMFQIAEAVSFISGVLESSDRNDCVALANEMQCFPLALQQAVSYIKVQNTRLQNIGSHFNISHYLNRLKEKGKSVLNFSFPKESDVDYNKTVNSTWNVTLDLIRNSEYGKEALKIMYRISFMESENIPIELIESFYRTIEEIGCYVNENLDISSALDLLQQYSMITIHRILLSLNEYVVVVSVHRLVQEVIRFKLEKENKKKIVLEDAFIVCDFLIDVNYLNLPHLISVWNYYTKDGVKSQKDRYRCCMVAHKISDKLMMESRVTELYSFTKNANEFFFFYPCKDCDKYLHDLKLYQGVALKLLGKDDEADKIMNDIRITYKHLVGQCIGVVLPSTLADALR